ncbi:MAG: 4'-phosphopantetheinyl transferase superfamily protein [Hyphomonadaceae bacterium]|nr:4'-phosphopantetheinyl transferase superfamily protein [Hyphomonadaceae bacterium]
METAPDIAWASAAAAPGAPGPDGLDLWRIDLRAGCGGEALSPEESARAGRFAFERDRAAYVAAHDGLRRILARYLGCGPRSLTFAVGEHGKPALADEPALRFNLTHAGDAALVAVASGRAVGVDVEPVRAIPDRDAVAALHFSAAECAQLEAAAADARDDAFYAVWTRKEAFIKCRGEGLSLPLSSFSVSLDAPTRLIACDGDDPARYALHAFRPRPGYWAAACAEGPIGAVQYFQFS